MLVDTRPRRLSPASPQPSVLGVSLISLVFQPGSVRPVGSSLARLATDPPREGRSFLVLPNTVLDAGEAELGGRRDESRVQSGARPRVHSHS